MKPRSAFLAACSAAVLIAGCGEQSISTISPIYVLVDSAGTMRVDVLDQSNFEVSGTIDIAQVGDAPPIGALAAMPGGRVLVTHTGSVVGQRTVLSPGTLACTLATSQCATVWSGWGSATAAAVNGSVIAVPAWDFSNFTSGRLAFFGGDGLDMTRQVPLDPSMPGPAAVSADGRYMYWITYQPPVSGASVQQQLVRVGTVSGRIEGGYRFGQRLPSSVAIDPSGNVFVSILYDRAPVPPKKAGAQPVPGVPGSTVEVFPPDLSAPTVIGVQQSPSLIAVAGGHLLVASTGTTRGEAVGLFDLPTGHPRGSFAIPAGWSVEALQTITLASGLPVGIVVLNMQGGARSRIGVVDLAVGDVTWHDLDGHVLGSVAA